MRKIYTLLFVAAISSVAAAQEDSTAKSLDAVIITGQYKPQSMRNSVYQVRVVNSERIRLSGATTIQQVLNTQLGFRFVNDNTLGTTDVQLMGMSGRNVKILLDGLPMIDRGDTRESLGQVDINTIERIEIVEGPMSVTYGSDALAGVINIITKKNARNRLTVWAKAQEETAGKEYYPFSYKGVHHQAAGFSRAVDRWQFSLGGNHNEFDGFGGDAYGRGKSWRPKEQWIGNGKIDYGTDKWNVYYRLDGTHETITNRAKINMANYKAVDQQYITRRFLHQAQGEYRFNSRLNASAVIACTDYERQTKTTRRNFENNSIEPNQPGENDLSTFNSFLARTVMNYQPMGMFSLQPGFEFSHDKAGGARIKGKPVINDFAFFVSSEIKPGKKVNIRPGLRFIMNSVYDAPPVIPSINTKWVLGKQLDLRLAYAYGFRSPALRELYFNFIDGNHTIIGNPDLKAEHSNSFTGSLNWSPKTKEKEWVVTLGGFYNLFNNLINYASSPTSNDTTITVNIDKFKTTGITLENRMNWKDLKASAGFSYIGRYNQLSADKTYEQEQLPQFVWTPEVNANLDYTVKTIKTTVALFYKYTGKRPGYEVVFNPATTRDELRLTKVSSFHWADLTLTTPLLKFFTVNAGIKNLFDVTDLKSSSTAAGSIHTGGPALATSYGRSYFLGLQFQWNKK